MRSAKLVVALLAAAMACGMGLPAAAVGGTGVDHVVVAAKLELSSSAIRANKPIPAEYTCDGADQSPPLSWNKLPYGTQTVALVVDDPDAPGGTWVHWVVYNLPTSIRELPPGIHAVSELPNGGRQGTNSFKRIGYGGPCPPQGTRHRYFFRLYALDTALDLAPGATKAQLMQAMEPHILGVGELIATYARQ